MSCSVSADDFPGGRLTVDLAALGRNWRTLAAVSPARECGAVVKADAYGIGLAEASDALFAAGARTFFVAQLSEAKTVRGVAPDAMVYVLNGLLPGAAGALSAAGARPVLGSPQEIDEWAAHIAATGADPAAAVHVDTGMNRLGLTPDEARTALGAGLPFRPSLLMSHLACADEPERPETAAQRAVFAELRSLLPNVPASLANSAGTLAPTTTGGDLAFDLCRPGVALYGSNPVAGSGATLEPVIRLEARVIQLRDARKGDPVGYGGAERLKRDSRIAVLSLGYADGVLRAGGSEDGAPGATAFVGGVRCPYVGRISMDLIAIDVTDAPERAIDRGTRVEILGDHIGVDDLARACGTIGYEVLTSLGRRYERRYIS